MYLQIQAQFGQALAHFERASDMHKQLVETEPAITIASYIYLFKHNYYQGKYVQADQPIRKALRLVEQAPGSELLTKATCLEAIAYLSYQQGKYSQSEDYFLQTRLKLGLPPIEEREFRYEFNLMTVQRQLKAIGTFSYQTGVCGRGQYYEKYIGPAVATVLRGMSGPGMKEYPALRRALEKM